MALDPSVLEQEQIAESLQRHGETLSPTERRAEIVVSGAFVVAVAVLLVVFAPTKAAWDAPAATACMLAR